MNNEGGEKHGRKEEHLLIVHAPTCHRVSLRLSLSLRVCVLSMGATSANFPAAVVEFRNAIGSLKPQGDTWLTCRNKKRMSWPQHGRHESDGSCDWRSSTTQKIGVRWIDGRERESGSLDGKEEVKRNGTERLENARRLGRLKLMQQVEKNRAECESCQEEILSSSEERNPARNDEMQW